jgi:DNA primase
MMMFSADWLAALRSRVPLSSLIGQSITLRKVGRDYEGLCPFHPDTHPSFTVSDIKGFFHCFSCPAHGDAISWIMKSCGLGFVDAVTELATRTQMELPARNGEHVMRAITKNKHYEVMAAARRWYAGQLHGQLGKVARDHLAKRGITNETIARFGLGFAPDAWRSLRSALATYGDTLLIETGLLIAREGRAPYDRFRGRIMIPIRDACGRVIGFGARALGDAQPKYLNSPQTVLFDKGRTLFNLDHAVIAAHRAKRLIVVEGYFDVIALAQEGIKEVVSPLGTALTAWQLERLWQINDTPLIAFDGDMAGRSAAVALIGRTLPILKGARSLNFIELEDAYDPEDMIRSAGVPKFNWLVDNARPLSEHLWQHEFNAQCLNTPEARAGLRQRLMARVASIKDVHVRGQYESEYRARFEAAFPVRSLADV